MSAYGMKPSFKNKEEYKEWMKGWKQLYKDVSQNIRRHKHKVKAAQREGVTGEDMAAMRAELKQERAMGAKAMTLLDEAKIRWQNIQEMKRGIAEQHAMFPLTVENVRNMDFHFNKKHLEFPDIVPMWIIKAKGHTWYCRNVVSKIGFTTRETPDHSSTKGAIRIKRGTIHIDANANAVIS